MNLPDPKTIASQPVPGEIIIMFDGITAGTTEETIDTLSNDWFALARTTSDEARFMNGEIAQMLLNLLLNAAAF